MELALFPSNIASKLSQQILNHSKILPENVFKSAIIQDASILTGDLNALEIQYLVEKHVDSQIESSYSRFSTRILLHDFKSIYKLLPKFRKSAKPILKSTNHDIPAISGNHENKTAVLLRDFELRTLAHQAVWQAALLYFGEYVVRVFG